MGGWEQFSFLKADSLQECLKIHVEQLSLSVMFQVYLVAGAAQGGPGAEHP